MVRITFLALLVFLLCACGSNDEQVTTPTTPDSTVITTPAPAPITQTSERYTWVDDLNLRDAPSTRGKVLTKLSTSERLNLTGQQSGSTEAIVLRGGLYEEPWYEVETDSGVKGWVFGGALKAAGERKGNAPLSLLKFNHPRFGHYDLSRWEKLSTEPFEGGDVVGTTTTYRGNGERMIVEESGSEYGYRIEYKRLNLKGDPLQTRTLFYDNMSSELTEEVVSYLEEPKEVYRRVQKVSKPYQQLSSKPLVVQGDLTRVTDELEETE